jgi:hypothetical protein
MECLRSQVPGLGMNRTQVRRGQGYRCIEIGDHAGFGEGDHPIGLVLADLARQPLRQFELHDGRHQP